MDELIPILIFAAIFIFNLVKGINEQKKQDKKRTAMPPVVADPVDRGFTPQQPSSSRHEVNKPLSNQQDHSNVERMEELLRKQRELLAKQEREKEEKRRKEMALKNKNKENINKKIEKKENSPFLNGEADNCSIDHHEEVMSPMKGVEEEVEPSVSIDFTDMDEVKRAFVYSEVLSRRF